jgi:hypothetical protein
MRSAGKKFNFAAKMFFGSGRRHGGEGQESWTWWSDLNLYCAGRRLRAFIILGWSFSLFVFSSLLLHNTFLSLQL